MTGPTESAYLRDRVAKAEREAEYQRKRADATMRKVREAIAATTVRFTLDDGAFAPIRAHTTDAGADLRTPVAFTLSAHDSATVDTGVHVELPHGTCARVEPKSGLNVNGCIVCWGLVDEGYTGSIVVKLYNLGDKAHRFERGDKVAQLTVSPVMYPDLIEVDAISGGARGDAGFGSTGR